MSRPFTVAILINNSVSGYLLVLLPSRRFFAYVIVVYHNCRKPHSLSEFEMKNYIYLCLPVMRFSLLFLFFSNIFKRKFTVFDNVVGFLFSTRKTTKRTDGKQLKLNSVIHKRRGFTNTERIRVVINQT